MSAFKTRPHRFSVGLAPTARALCRGCRKPIAKGDTRLVIDAFVRPNRSTRFVRHVACIGAALAAEIAKAHGSLERVIGYARGGMGKVLIAIVCAARYGTASSDKPGGATDSSVKGSRGVRDCVSPWGGEVGTLGHNLLYTVCRTLLACGMSKRSMMGKGQMESSCGEVRWHGVGV